LTNGEGTTVWRTEPWVGASFHIWRKKRALVGLSHGVMPPRRMHVGDDFTAVVTST